MGSYLRDDLGDAYFPVGLIAKDVYVNWPGTQVGMVSPVLGSAEQALDTLGPEALWLDLAELDPGDPVLPSTGGSVRVGGYSMVPNEQFDALVWLRESPGMVYVTE